MEAKDRRGFGWRPMDDHSDRRLALAAGAAGPVSPALFLNFAAPPLTANLLASSPAKTPTPLANAPGVEIGASRSGLTRSGLGEGVASGRFSCDRPQTRGWRSREASWPMSRARGGDRRHRAVKVSVEPGAGDEVEVARDHAPACGVGKVERNRGAHLDRVEDRLKRQSSTFRTTPPAGCTDRTVPNSPGTPSAGSL